MSRNRKSLTKPRTRAFSSQNGRCYYCNQPMWEKDPQMLASKHGITLRQAKFLQSTGEHLHAHSKGGGIGADNIVAACKYCNQHRHRRNNPPAPGDYKFLVQKRLKKGGWHGLRLA